MYMLKESCSSSPVRPAPGASCSVCWQDFSQKVELDEHIRRAHPDRVSDLDELLVRAQRTSGALSA